MSTRGKQKLAGLLIALAGTLYTAWMWHTALNDGYYYRKASMIFPAFFIIGLGMIIFPGYKEERVARGQDISGLQGMKLITPRWWAVLIIAMAAGGLNLFLLSRL
jgi:ABC-type Fe3+-siderophore transport system permease subunit